MSRLSSEFKKLQNNLMIPMVGALIEKGALFKIPVQDISGSDSQVISAAFLSSCFPKFKK